MQNVQDKVNSLAKLLRVQVIEYLIKEDIFKYRGERLNDVDLMMTVKLINKIPCCTRKLPELFRDAHRMHEAKGMMPHAATIADLEFCMKQRYIGFQCSQRIAHSWLPYKEDEDLRRLPAFKQLAQVYAPLIQAGKKILPPVDERAVENEADAIINELATNLIGG